MIGSNFMPDRGLVLLMFRWRVMLSIFYVVFYRLVGAVDFRTKPLRFGRLAHHRFCPASLIYRPPFLARLVIWRP